MSSDNKTLEAKVAKLEKEFKTLQDTHTQTAALLRLEQAKTAQLEKERDDLLLNVKARMTERDAVFAQYDSFRKNLKDLIGQADTAMAEMKPGSATVSTLPMPSLVDER